MEGAPTDDPSTPSLLDHLRSGIFVAEVYPNDVDFEITEHVVRCQFQDHFGHGDTGVGNLEPATRIR